MTSLGRFGIPIGVVLIVVMMVIPLPTILLDLLIAGNISFALLILLVSMFVRRPLDFSVFPSLLLVATLFRLALNISATRLVLLDGYAGTVIQSFGHVVIGGSLIVGLVIFMILIVIQFVVVTNGAGRVAEVGARFTLDAMPGKQMAIDADLNAGLIDDDEARRRRAEVAAEADFYGAMDGASKFVKGDAIAAIVITVVNLVGGLLVGVLQRHLPVSTAIHDYSLLSVGDGLASQIPALLLSVSTGLIVTRSATSGDMGSDVARQLTQHRVAVRLGAGAVIVLGLLPGMPMLPFLLVGGVGLVLSGRLPAPEEVGPASAPSTPASPTPDSPEALAAEMRVDPLALELAADLVDIVDTARGGDLLERVRALRRKLALETGLVMPLLRTRDNLEMPLSTYGIKINGIEAARGEAPAGCVLAIGDDLAGLPGRATHEPVFGLAGKWVPAELRHQAELAGATVVDRTSVVTTHLAEVVRTHASRLLGREDVRALVDQVKRVSPVVVEELSPALLSLGEIQRVLQGLLDEQVPIRDLVRIFEALSVRAKTSTDLDALVETARAALGPAVSEPYVTDGTVAVLTLDPQLEALLAESLRPSESGLTILLDPRRAEAVVGETTRLLTEAEDRGVTPLLACAAGLRAPLRRMLRVSLPRLPVLAYSELVSSHRIETIGMVNLVHASAA
ncbi:MAG: flagellar biosynthesis protein FlhA [Actinomycetes bacterium]